MDVEQRTDLERRLDWISKRVSISTTDRGYISFQMIEFAEQVVKNLTIPDVIHWVATKDELPKVHTKVLLYNDDGKNYALEFIHEFDLTTDRYTRNWTHWAEFKPPDVVSTFTCSTCGTHEKEWSIKNNDWYCKTCKHLCR